MFKQALLCVLLFGCTSSYEERPGDPSGGSFGQGGGPSDGGAPPFAEAGAAGSSLPEGGFGGFPEPIPGDRCDNALDANEEGEQQPDGTLIVQGTTVGARKDHAACSNASANTRDVVVSYTAPQTGGLGWTLEATTPTLFLAEVRSECSSPNSGLYCEECGVSCLGELEVEGGDTLYFVVNGIPTTNSPDGMGDFELSLLLRPDPEVGGPCLSPREGGRPCPEPTVCQEAVDQTRICGEPACGDGFLGFGAFECEDGNDVSGDGCSSECEIDVQGPGGASCAMPVVLHLPRIRALFEDTVLSFAGATGPFVDGSDVAPGCAQGAGPEAVYVIELEAKAEVELNATGADSLSVRPMDALDCGIDEVACLRGTPDAVITLTLSLDPGRYAIIVDRDSAELGLAPEYELTVAVTPGL